jgi:membrane protein DedA with SNARE-associated domain
MSLPAGIVRMPYWKFIGLTLAGSGIWHSILIILGYIVGDNTELIKRYMIQISVAIVIFVAALWMIRHYRKKHSTKKH